MSDRRPRRKRHPVLRWLKRIVLGLVVLVVVAIVGALAAIHTDWGRERVRQIAVDQLDNIFVGGVTVGKLEGSPFGELVVRDVVINGPDGKPAVKAGAIKLHIALTPLMHKQAHLEDLVIEDLDVDTREDLAHLLVPGPSGGWNVTLDDVRVVRGHLVAPGQGDGEVMNFDDVTIAAKATVPHGGPIDASLILNATWRERDKAPVAVLADLHNDGRVTLVPSLIAKVGDVAVAAGNLRIETAMLEPREIFADADMVPWPCSPAPQHAAVMACIPAPKTAAPPVVSGLVVANVPRGAVTKLAPAVVPPEVDVALVSIIDWAGPDSLAHLRAFGAVNGAPFVADVTGDVAARRARGFVTATGVDVAPFAPGHTGVASAIVAFDATAPEAGSTRLPIGSAVGTVWGTEDKLPPLAAGFLAATDGEYVVGQLSAGGGGGAVQTSAAARIAPDRVEVLASRLIADVPRLDRLAVAKKLVVAGSIKADLAAHGVVKPDVSMAVTGNVHGSMLRYQDAAIATLDLDVAADRLPKKPYGRAKLELHGIVKGTTELDEVGATAQDRADGSIAVTIRTRPKHRPWLLDADAVVKYAAAETTIDVTHHHLRANGADWVGSGGRVVIAPNRYAIQHFSSASARGTLTIDGSFVPGRLKLDAVASGQMGDATVAVDVDAPMQPGDVAAWTRTSRAAVRKLDVTAAADLDKVAATLGLDGPMTGHIAAELHGTGGDIQGHVSLTGIRVPQMKQVGDLGGVSGTIDLKDDPTGAASANADLTIAGVGNMAFEARGRTPVRLADPVAWKALTRDSLEGATLKFANLDVDPALLDRLGVTTPLRAKAGATIEIAQGARSVHVASDVVGFQGGPLVLPIDVHADAVLDDRGAKAAVTVDDGAPPTTKTTLFEAHVTSPLTLAQVMANPMAAKGAKLDGRITLPAAPAARLLREIGRSDVVSGTVDGTVTIAGTAMAPTAVAKIALRGVEVPAGRGTREKRLLEELLVDATWDGKGGKATITGKESGGGTLKVVAAGAPTALDKATVSLEATNFDVRPMTAFAPGMAGAITGVIDGKITVVGVDPRTADVAGKLTVKHGRIPLAPAVGTLRAATIEVEVKDRVAKVSVDGKLGKGTISAKATAPLTGESGDATITLRGVTPIAEVEPQISADVTAKLRRVHDRWEANVKISNGYVVVPDERGHKLDPVGLPPDFAYGSANEPHAAVAPAPAHVDDPRKPAPKTPAPPPPAHPVLVATIELGTTKIESSQLRGLVDGKLRVTLGGTPPGAPPVRVVGSMQAERGDLDLFDRRYQLDRAVATFDGSVDPNLDVRITYDFPDVTTVTQVRGRLSKPELVLTSEPARYSQDELLGFLLGGEPNGDVNQSQSASAKVTGAGESYVANQVGGYVKKALPLDIDVLRYESASATNSAAITVGTWVTHELFLAYRHHLEARPDENTGEGEAEYWLARRLSLQATAGDRGYDGLDLLWRKRW